MDKRAALIIQCLERVLNVVNEGGLAKSFKARPSEEDKVLSIIYLKDIGYA